MVVAHNLQDLFAALEDGESLQLDHYLDGAHLAHRLTVARVDEGAFDVRGEPLEAGDVDGGEGGPPSRVLVEFRDWAAGPAVFDADADVDAYISRAAC